MEHSELTTSYLLKVYIYIFELFWIVCWFVLNQMFQRNYFTWLCYVTDSRGRPFRYIELIRGLTFVAHSRIKYKGRMSDSSSYSLCGRRRKGEGGAKRKERARSAISGKRRGRLGFPATVFPPIALRARTSLLPPLSTPATQAIVVSILWINNFRLKHDQFNFCICDCEW